MGPNTILIIKALLEREACTRIVNFLSIAECRSVLEISADIFQPAQFPLQQICFACRCLEALTACLLLSKLRRRLTTTQSKQQATNELQQYELGTIVKVDNSKIKTGKSF